MSAPAMLATPQAPAAPRAPAGKAAEAGGPKGRDEPTPSFDRMLDAGRERAPAASTPSSEGERPAAGAAGPQDEGTTAAPSDGLPLNLLNLLASLEPAAPAPEPELPGAPPPDAPAALASNPRGTPLPSLPTAAPREAAPAFALAMAAEPAAPVAVAADRGTAGADPATAEPAAPLAPLSAAPSTAARAPTVAPVLPPIAQPSDPQAGFDDAFSGRIVWMAEQRLGHAEIRITPEHLGSIDVRLQLDGAKVSAEFFTAQADVKQALEASFSRLRDMLGQHGLQLAHADVGQQRSGQSNPGTGAATTRDSQPEPEAEPAPVVARSRRLLDEYA